MDLFWCLRAQRQNFIFAGDVSGADKPAESLRARVVGKFALGLDVEVAVFHGDSLHTETGKPYGLPVLFYPADFGLAVT